MKKILDIYIDSLKEKTKLMDLTEEELIMYIYIDLGSRLKYDDDFYLSTHRKQKYLYSHSTSIDDINHCFASGNINCRSVSYILYYILKQFNVNVKVVENKNDLREFHHVYNVIKPHDNSESYIVDLQDDMINIHFHSKTLSFGRKLDDSGYVTDLKRQKEIHQKIGYISKHNIYTDEYIDVLKTYSSMYQNFYDKFDFIISNIDPLVFENVNYWERRWKHERILRQIFNNYELSRKVHTIEFYKRNDKEKLFINGYYVHSSLGVLVYLYENGKYEKYPVREFAHKVITDKIEYRQNVEGLNSRVKSFKRINN